jgi:CHAT domain-containing protein/tetratricopeptide (TPR) repeat protein
VRAVLAIGIASFLFAPGSVIAQQDAAERKIPSRLADCDAWVAESPETIESYRCYWFVGRNHNQLNDAARRLESLLELDPTNPHALLNLGVIAADLGQKRAEGLCREALDGYVNRGDGRGEIYGRISVSMLLRRRGRTQQASEQLRAALDRAVELNDDELEAQVRVSLGWQKYYEREYGEALELLSKAEDLVIPGGAIHQQLGTLDGLAAVSWALGRLNDALGYYRRMLDLMRGNDPYRESGIRRNMAIVATGLAQNGRMSAEEMIRLKRDALAAAVRGGNRLAEVGARLSLAQSLPGPEGLEEARSALAAVRKTGMLSDICWALWLIGEKSHELDPNDPERALAPVEEAIELARTRGDAELLAKGLLVRARIRWGTGHRRLAIEESVAALEAVERIRDLQPDGEVRARVFSRFDHAYLDLATSLLAGHAGPVGPGDVERAFEVTERMRARSLLETLDAAGATAALAPSGPLPDARSEVLGKIAAVRTELGHAQADSVEGRRLRTRLSELEGREASLRRSIAETEPGFAALRGIGVPSIEELKRELGEDQALVAFLIDERRGLRVSERESRSWAIVVSRAKVRGVPLPDCRDLRRRVRLYLSLLDRKDGSERGGAERLYTDLLSEVLAGLPDRVSRLVVIPDGPLHRLPFGALIDPDSGAFMASRYTIAIAPSATAWVRWKRSTSAKADSALLAFADPHLPPGPDEDGASEKSDLVAMRDLGPLPDARREAEKLRRHLGNGSRVLVGQAASEAALKSTDLTGLRLLHFASHAVVNDEHPDRSAIVLAADPADEGEDGFVRFREVVRLDLDGQVVVLSACRSASGPLIGGEGVMGLANAFFQAGARAVVAGLWPVRDRETSMLVDRLGRHLSEGRSLATALALARREMLSRGLPPSAWAGMIVLGDGDHVPFPDGSPRRWDRSALFLAAFGMIVGAALGAIAFGLYLQSRLRRRYL